MAHHMLYTVMRDYTCYDGYLWAPFDTLLNVPRLVQFDQTRMWYHSPWGEYVPNPALSAVEAVEGIEGVERWRNESAHPPPANISPDPEGNVTDTWRGWQKDWWYVIYVQDLFVGT